MQTPDYLLRHRLEDALGYWKAAGYGTLLLLVLLLVPDAPALHIGGREVIVAVSAALLLLHLR